MNSFVKEALVQLGFKFARSGRIHTDDYDLMKLKNAGISEAQMINAYRYGEQETPLRFTRTEGKYKVTIILRENPNKQGDYQLVSCWLAKSWK